jgi:hypothetical protein
MTTDPDIRVLFPRAEGPLEPTVVKATRNHLIRTYGLDEDQARLCLPDSVIHWGKISFLNGGDKIRGAELVQHSEHNMTRDASFIKVFPASSAPNNGPDASKFSHSIDKNARFRNLPVVEERRVAYGQLLRILEFKIKLPRGHQPRRHHLILAVIRPVRQSARSNKLGFWYYQEGQFEPVEVIDVDDVSCLVARVPAPKSGPRLWALCERQDAMGVSEDLE